MQCPLCAIVVVPPNSPRLCLCLPQRLEGFPYGRLLSMPTLSYPGRIDVLGHVVRVCVREKPRNQGRHHRRQNEPPGARKGAPRYARKRRIMVPCARLADGPDRVDVSGDEEEEGNRAAAADAEAEEGQLE
jgi:hypothetical protein